jgi:hypothetical protein
MKELHSYITTYAARVFDLEDQPSTAFRRAATTAGVDVDRSLDLSALIQSLTVTQLCDVLDTHGHLMQNGSERPL